MNINVISGAVFLAASIAYYMGAQMLPTSILDTAVSSSTFPKIIGGLGAILSVALILQGVMQRQPAPVPAGREATIRALWTRHRRPVGLLLLATGYILLLELFGYVVALLGLIPTVAAYHGVKPDYRLALVTVIGAGLFWLFFAKLLAIHMPPGIVWRALGIA